jgi:hypothetical protein
MNRGWLLAGMAAALLAGPALAQAPASPPDDPIGDLLAKQDQEPDEAAQPPSPPVPRSSRGAVSRELSDAAYDARIRASMAAAQTYRGPLEGGWTIASPDGDLYALQLSDRKGVVEGAWRDLRRTGAVDASGFIDEVQVSGSEVTVRFAGGRVIAALHGAPGRPWTGELTEAGQTRPVSLKRRGP